MRTKYIVFDFDAIEDMIIFSGLHTHDQIANNFLRYTPISAGFIEINDGKPFCYGKSISLELESREIDTKIALRVLNLQ